MRIRLPPDQVAKLDAIIILDTYHEMDDHDEILAHVKNSLKPGGKLVICEPIADERRKLARDDQERRHELGTFRKRDSKSLTRRIRSLTGQRKKEIKCGCWWGQKFDASHACRSLAKAGFWQNAKSH